ncbi:hypothetical protein [Facklamia sp. 7083-14-GEN3]|uniref:hypothetical protein n=1 Tax=Facklamia sp. 7083-14-GEN3 TaxID=2973478 RepID=UPI00215CBCE4|nr:hypothetical protein [Facklamia sp. 7083-14-GEN3]MCR8969820.1 hypothetical protein [Facklamia sp. 7083-14-GEN3]
MQKIKNFFYCFFIGITISLSFSSVSSIRAVSDPFIPRPALPSDLKKVDDSVEIDEGAKSEEDSQEISDPSEDQGLFETDIVIYPLNEFEDKQSLENFTEYIKNDSNLNSQVIIEDVSESNRFLLSARYHEKATEEGQLIVLYFPVNISDKDKAIDVLEKNLLYYPDLFKKGEITQQNDGYDLAFGLRVNVNTNSFGIDTEKQEIYYYDQRQPYRYELEFNDYDPYRQAIEERFPGEFNFESEDKDGKVIVTLSQLPLSDGQTNIQNSEEALPLVNDLFTQIKTNIDYYLTQTKIKEKLINLGISEDNVSIVTIGAAVVLLLLGIVLIIFGFRR